MKHAVIPGVNSVYFFFVFLGNKVNKLFHNKGNAKEKEMVIMIWSFEINNDEYLVNANTEEEAAHKVLHLLTDEERIQLNRLNAELEQMTKENEHDN